jgi:hypothetical protein
MRFYFNEDNDVPRCVLCGSTRFTNLEFCDDCGEWLCRDICKNNWTLRGLAMMVRGKKRLSERFS